jgi:iron(III) transport system substrate-binding protein
MLSSTDTSFFAPVIEAFLQQNPDLRIVYMVHGTAEIDRRFRASPDAFDVVISSAMDLQLKLVNDGYAEDLSAIEHPQWAQWRQSLFAFTTEPAAIVVNAAAFEDLPLPQTRQDLIEVLRRNPDTFDGKVGTYDVRESGLGYLFGTQDARATESYWRLMEVMGSLGVRLYCCSGAMIDDLQDGTILVAYNVLSSYAQAVSAKSDTISIVLPSDFPTTMMRTAFVSRSSVSNSLGEAFVSHLILFQSRTDQSAYTLPRLDGGLEKSAQSSIILGPALMTYLDTLKRQTFIREWESAINQ